MPDDEDVDDDEFVVEPDEDEDEPDEDDEDADEPPLSLEDFSPPDDFSPVPDEALALLSARLSVR